MRSLTTSVAFTLPRAGRLVDLMKAYLVVVPVGEIGPLLASGAVRVGDHCGGINDVVVAGEVVAVDPAALGDRALVPHHEPLAVAYEDDDLVIVDKPAGMHVHPLGPYRDGTLLNALLWHAGARTDQPWAAWRPSPLHRLDRAASGLVAFAKSAALQDVMRRVFADNGIERIYHAIIEGSLRGERGTIDAPLGRDPALDYRRAVVALERGGQRAVTHWRVIERARDCERTVLEVVLETGRTHQIRAHLASIGHPIVGDALYASTTAVREDAARTIALHAVELRLTHPRRFDPLVVRSVERRRNSSLE